MNNGMLVVFSAPSGCGKDTVFKELCKRHNNIVESVSATTRKPRKGEVNGVDYFFVSEEDFRHMINNDGLLEYAMYNGNYYGTPVKGVNESIRVMKLFPDCVSIFLVPPSEEILAQRLYKRKTDNEQTIKSRLEIAKVEMTFKDNYTYTVVNDNLDVCVDTIDKILCDELKKRNA